MVLGAQGQVLNAAVVGQPVAHSLSPVLHNAAYRATGLDGTWRYAAHEVGAADLPAWVAGLDQSWRGLSLTMPLKEVALEVADAVSETASVTGSANTLVRRDDLGWDADNTDVRGLELALAGCPHEGEATVLGAGATARSALVALHRLGVRAVHLAVRSQPRPETAALAERLGLALVVVPLAEWSRRPWRLAVSTLPPEAGEDAAAALTAAGAATLPGEAALLDVVYADWPTPLARAAEAAGARVVSGLDMLVHQAAEQFRLFTGVEAPLDVMFAAGREALAR